MSQHDFTTINPAAYSGTDLASDLNQWIPAVLSSHSGASRPSYALAGMVWFDTGGDLKFYNGSTDDLILKGDITAFGVSLAEAADATAARTLLGLSTVSQAEAEAGTSTTTRSWTAQRVKQAIDALAGSGGADTDLSNLSATGNTKIIRARVKFNGIGVPVIDGQVNVASVTRTAVGRYTITFTNALPDANYSLAGSLRRVGFPQTGIPGPLDGGTYSTTTLQISTTDDGGTSIDPSIVNIIVVG